MKANRAAFTLIEVLGCVLVLSVGLAAAIGMVLYGIQIAKLSMGRATAMATAMSVAIDPSPLQSSSPTWSIAVPGSTKGYLNSYYIIRTEGDPITISSGFTVADVVVDVYETARGRLIASYNQRLVKKSP